MNQPTERTMPTLSDARRAALDILSSRTMAEVYEPRLLADFVMGLTDETAVDEAWLRSMGWREMFNVFAFSIGSHQINCSQKHTYLMVTDKEDNEAICLPEQHTRGQLAMLLLALKGE